MIVLLLLVFNGLILFFVLDLIVQVFFVPTQIHLFLCGIFAFLAVVGLAFLFNSSAGQWLLRFISGARRAIGREHQQLDPIIERVQHAIQETCELKPLSVHLMVIDDPVPNAMAISKSTLVVTRGLYETANEEELAGVIAHEMGHLHNGDSQKLGIALGVSVVSMVIAFLAGLVVSITGVLNSVKSKSDVGAILQLFSFILMLFSGFFLLFVWLGNGIFKLAMLFQGRKQEYKADQFAIKIGFSAGLLSFLEKIKNFEYQGKATFMSRLYATHPPVMLRIGEVEKLVQSE